MAFRLLTDFIQEDVITNFIIDTLDKKLVARNIVTNHTQAELGYGSSYKIPGTSALTLTQYNGTAVTPENLSTTNEIISIDQYPFISFYLNDSDVTEATALNSAMIYAQRAAYQIALAVDTYVLKSVFDDATTATALGVTTAPIALTDSTKVLDYIEDFATKLREGNADMDAVIVIPSFMATALSKEIGIKAGNDGINGAIVEGYVARLFGLDIFTSNNIPTGVAGGLVAGEYGVIGGKRDGFHLITGTTIVKSGISETHPASFNQFGQVYGAGYSQTLSWFGGVVTK